MLKQKLATRINNINTLGLIAILLLHACNNNESTVSYDDSNQAKKGDSIKIAKTDSTVMNPIDNGAPNKFIGSKEAEKEARIKLINMQIDSTYAALNLLDQIKEEINTETDKELTKAERNKKSKAIFNLNIIQNELTRALDASILANLKLRTTELEGISKDLENNVTHLQDVTQKLTKVTQTIGRLIDILALGLSQGWVKPLTPKTVTPATVKAGVK